MSADDLEKYETDMELQLYREYKDVVGIFKYVVETERRFYLCNAVDLKVRTEGGDVYFEVTMADAWVWDVYRSARFVKNAKVGTMDADKVVFYNDTTTTIAAPATGNLDTIIMFTNAKCQDPKTGTRTGGSSRSMVAMYRVETGGSDDTQCVESGS